MSSVAARACRAVAQLRSQPMRPFARNNAYKTHGQNDYIGCEVLGCMQDPTLPDLGHARYVVDDGVVGFCAFLPKRNSFSAVSGSANGTCAAYIVTKSDGEVVLLGVDKEAFPADYHQVPLIVAQQMAMTLVSKAAAGLKSNDVLSLKTSDRHESSPSALLGLLPALGGMHRHGSLLVGRQPKVLAWCNKTLSEEYRGDGTTIPTDSLVWHSCKPKDQVNGDSLALQAGIVIAEELAAAAVGKTTWHN